MIENEILKIIKNCDDKLPSENELAIKFNVSRFTIRKILNQFYEMGFCYSIKGKGWFKVNEKSKIPIIPNINDSFNVKMNELGYKIENDVICTKYVKNIFFDNYDGNVFEFSILIYVDGIACVKQSTFIKEEYMNDDIYNKLSIDEHYKKLKLNKLQINNIKLHSRIAIDDEIKIVNGYKFIPILILEYDTIQDNQVIDFTRIMYNSNLFYFKISL